MTTYTPSEAIDELQRLADYAENENYREVASTLYAVMKRVEKINERTLVLVSGMYGNVAEFLIVP